MNSGQYGQKWEILWEKLEQEGNVGLDYVINPYLYLQIIKTLGKTPQAFVVDFGCGTNIMGIQLLYGHASSIPALQKIEELQQARFNTMLYLGIEKSERLVEQSKKYLKDLGNPANIATICHPITSMPQDLFNKESVNLCVSRQFLMHLDIEEYKQHLQDVHSILKPNSHYIFSTLNPEYEQTKAEKHLENGEKYQFPHGKHGEHGSFSHFYKEVGLLEEEMEKLFNIREKIECQPITKRFLLSHSRYYRSPIAYVYVLEKIG